MQTFIKSVIVLLLFSTGLKGQDSKIDRLIKTELKMTFPSVYFKHNSTDYAEMPYSVDSCFKHIALNFKENTNSLVMWRDSIETEKLTEKRIKKIKQGLAKYMRNKAVHIHSMGQQQKISRRTMNLTSDSAKVDYLLSLNSVFDFSKTKILAGKKPKKKSRRRLVWTGWRTGFHWSTAG